MERQKMKKRANAIFSTLGVLSTIALLICVLQTKQKYLVRQQRMQAFSDQKSKPQEDDLFKDFEFDYIDAMADVAIRHLNRHQNEASDANPSTKNLVKDSVVTYEDFINHPTTIGESYHASEDGTQESIFGEPHFPQRSNFTEIVARTQKHQKMVADRVHSRDAEASIRIFGYEPLVDGEQRESADASASTAAKVAALLQKEAREKSKFPGNKPADIYSPSRIAALLHKAVQITDQPQLLTHSIAQGK